MIVDIHTHLFPPAFVRDRARLLELDPGFAALYRDPRAKMATAEDLLDSMQTAAVDVSVACGFWWGDPAIALEHAAYLVEAAAQSEGRIIPFVPVGAAVAPAGAAGIGEVREQDGAAVGQLSAGGGLPLLIHSTEEVGHRYPGKEGGLTTGGIWDLLTSTPRARVIAAHWGGGLPFFGLMPEVRAEIEAGRLVVDTAASAYLYDPAVFAFGIQLLGRNAVCWGSDFPLRRQELDRVEVEAALGDADDRAAVLGGNAARFLGLSARTTGNTSI